MTLSRRLPALILVLALAADHAVVCASWMAMRNARPEASACPMHQSDTPVESASGSVTPSAAARCCVASAPDGQAPLPSVVVSASRGAAVGPVPVAPLPEVRHHRSEWRLRLPVPDSHVPRHLLLSVLVV